MRKMFPAVVVAFKPFSRPVLARVNAPLHTDIVCSSCAFCRLIQAAAELSLGAS
jgi:hypothetical protein